MHRRIYQQLKTLLSALLIVALVVTGLPPAAFAVGASENATVQAQAGKFPRAAKAPVELVGRRTATTKEYLNPNGSFSIVSYAEPVHYRDSRGQLVDIDNQLISSDDPAFQYRNKANSFQASFASGAKTGDLVRMAKDADHWLSFSPVKTLQRVGQLTSLARSNGQVMRYGLDQNSELTYSLSSNRLKEEIVLNQYPGTNSFSFSLKTKGLTYRVEDDGLYHFVDEKGLSLFYLERPWAVDTTDDITLNAKLAIAPGKGGDILTVTVDDKWLREATYPVIIDPSVIDDTDSPANCSDTFASSSNPSSNYYTASFITAGTHPTVYGETEAFVRWDLLPSLPVGASIDKVELELHEYMTLSGSTTIQVAPVTSSWELTGLNWSNRPSVGSSTASMSGPAPGDWNFDITQVAKQWYAGTLANNGVKLSASPKTSNRRSFRSSNYTSDRPALHITYTLEPLGVQSFWGYAGNTNVLNGNLLLSATDVTLPGAGIPISISRTYNSRSTQDGNFGYGWSNNVGMRLSYTDRKVVQLADGTGTVYQFIRQSDGQYLAPLGVHYRLYEDGTTFILEDQSGVKAYFDADGNLDKVVDPNGNITDIVTDASGLVTHVVDPSHRYAKLDYYDTTPKRLKSVKLNTTPGSYLSSPANELAVEYTYDVNNNLQTVTKLNEGREVAVTFGYTGHNLTSITDPMGYVTSIDYDSNDRVKTFTKVLDSATSGIVDKSGYGQLNSATPGLGSVTTSLSYQPRVLPTDRFAMVTTVTDARGNRTVYSSTDQGTVEEITRYINGGTETYVLTWDQRLNLKAVMDPINTDPHNPQGQKTTDLDYDGSDRLTGVRNVEGYSSFYHYSGGDVVAASDFAARSSTQSYGEWRQVISATNQLQTTASFSYDGTGNVTEAFTPLTMAEDLLLNGGLETWSSGVPTNWVNLTPIPGTVSEDTLSQVGGERAARISGQTDGGTGYGRLATAVYTPVKAKGRYVVSWSAKTSNLGQSGAGLVVHWYNSSKTWIAWSDVLEPVAGNSAWSRHTVPVEAPANAAYARVEFRLLSAGTAWLDNVQLEPGYAINSTNYLVNAGFEVNVDDKPIVPDGWWSGSLTSADGVTTAASHAGTQSVLVNAGSSAKDFGLGVDTGGEGVAGVAGTTVTFAGWLKTSSLVGSAKVRLKVTYGDGSLGWFDAVASAGTHDWEYVESTIVVPQNFSRWSAYGWVGSGSGQVWFDDFSMRVSGASSSLVSDFNAVSNGSFELDLDGTNWPDDIILEKSTTQGTYDVSWVGAAEDFQPYAGAKAIRVKDVPAWIALTNGAKEELRDGVGYTGQVMVKTDHVTLGGAALKFDVFAGSNKLGQFLSKTIDEAEDWSKLSLSVTTAEILRKYPTATHIRFGAGAIGATTGTFYLDGLRFTAVATKTAYGYDPAGNYLEQVTDPLGNQVVFTSDAHGNVKTVQDPRGRVSSFTYDDFDQLRTATNAKNLLADYQYDDNGNLQTVTQLNGLQALSVNTSVYNELGLVTKVIDPLNHITQYRYDQNGNLAYVKAQSGQEAWFIYDQQDRLQEVQYLQAGVGHRLSFTYDKNGNRETAEHRVGNLSNPGSMSAESGYSYSYDGLNRLTGVTLPNGRRISYAYDPVGQVMSISNVAAGQVSYAYDYAGLSGTVNYGIATGVTSNVNYLYDEQGRVTKATRQITSGSELTTSVEYNAVGQITSLQTTNGVGAVIARNSYQYDPNGNRERDTLLDGSYVKYEYDDVNELLFERYYTAQGTLTKTLGYTYDLRGNRKTKQVTVGGSTITTSYDHNAANELTAINGVTVASTDGNQLSTGTHRLAFNTLGQVVQLQSLAGQVLEQYQYDVDGLRIAKLNAAGTVVEKYVYNGSQLAYVTDGADRVLYYFTRSASGALLGMVDCSGSTPRHYWYVLDGHGSVVALTDENGVVKASYSYDAWGNTLSTASSATTGDGEALNVANPFRYSSYCFDETSGLYYLNARYYSPELGRFLSEDRLAGTTMNPLSLNKYSYCYSNPTNYVDPDGETPLPGSFIFHRIVQRYVQMVAAAQGKLLELEKPIYGSSALGGLGRADLYYDGGGAPEIWEVKPDKAAYYRSGPEQLGRYVASVKGAERGQKLLGPDGATVRCMDGLVTITIREYDGMQQQGMIYYQAETTPRADAFLEGAGKTVGILAFLVKLSAYVISGGAAPAPVYP